MHHKSRQPRDFASEIQCLRIKKLNFLSQIFQLSRKEVLPLTHRSQICKKLLSSELARERLFLSFVFDIYSSHTFLWRQITCWEAFWWNHCFGLKCCESKAQDLASKPSVFASYHDLFGLDRKPQPVSSHGSTLAQRYEAACVLGHARSMRSCLWTALAAMPGVLVQHEKQRTKRSLRWAIPASLWRDTGHSWESQPQTPPLPKP